MEYLNALLPTIENLGGFGYWVVFLIAFSESLAFVGNLVPGSILMYLVGFISSRGYLNIIALIWFAAAGAICGDGLSYFLGTKGKHLFKKENKLLKLSYLEKGEEFFREHGAKSVFLGRFIGPLRPIVPFIAGLSKMDKKIFLLWNISSGFLWAIMHLLIGYFFGSAIDIVETWTTRAGLIIVSLAAALAIIWLVLKKSGPFFASLKLYFAAAREWINKTKFIAARLNTEKFYGLPLSLISIGFVYILFLFFGSVQGALSSGAIALLDKRVAALMFSFRDAGLIEFFSWVGLLAKWQVAGIFAIAATLIMYLWRKELYILAMWATISAAELFTYISRAFFYRPRPESAFYFNTNSSFPSGHSVMAVAFYGFIVYVLARHSRNWGRKTNVMFLGVATILSIGFSAVYLGESFLSDIWAGYLLGILCLLIGVSLSEVLKSRTAKEISAPLANAKILSAISLAACLIFYVGFAVRYNPPLSAVAESKSVVRVVDAASIFENGLSAQAGMPASEPRQAGKTPRLTEKLFGEKAQPLNFIVIAKNDAGLAAAMEKSGWVLADRTDVGTMFKLAETSIANQRYDSAPMTPSFWNAGVNSMGFEKPALASGVYSRRHLRIWKTNYETADGSVYFGTVRLDTVKLIFLHESSPYIDVERELLFSDLSAAGEISSSKKLQFTAPVAASKDLSETPFFTDGKLYEVVVK